VCHTGGPGDMQGNASTLATTANDSTDMPVGRRTSWVAVDGLSTSRHSDPYHPRSGRSSLTPFASPPNTSRVE
jgi:hypothetical protein